MIKCAFLPQEIKYDGSQLASHFAYRTARLTGDSIVAFIGACDIPFERMVDLVDVVQQSPIAGSRMLHFIVEHFGIDLVEAVLRQRMLISILQQRVNTRLFVSEEKMMVSRNGDDLFVGEKKLTISVATKSLTSCLIHLGVNINTEGVPVKAIGISEMILPPHPLAYPRFLAEMVMHAYISEMDDIIEASTLVRGVGDYNVH